MSSHVAGKAALRVRVFWDRTRNRSVNQRGPIQHRDLSAGSRICNRNDSGFHMRPQGRGNEHYRHHSPGKKRREQTT